MTYTDIQVRESLILRCLFPTMLHSPLPFGIFGPLLARISRVCPGYVSDPGELRSLSFFLFSYCEAAHFVGVIQNRGDLGTLRGEMLGNAGYVHGDTSRLNVGLYGYDGIRVERTDGIRAGRRP